MMTILIKKSETLLEHLNNHEVDGTSVGRSLFEGGRMFYPGRREIERELGFADPYTIEFEARTVNGLFQSINASIRLLAQEATGVFRGQDQTLDLLWETHAAYPRYPNEGPSLDRLVAALVMVQHVKDNGNRDAEVEHACTVFINGMIALGFPPSAQALEEIWDGAAPACVGLGLIDIP